MTDSASMTTVQKLSKTFLVATVMIVIGMLCGFC